MSRTCDFCGREAEYDGKTKMGPWADMCHECHLHYGVGIGLGLGQKLKRLSEVEIEVR